MSEWLKRRMDELPPDYSACYVALVDALRDYIRNDKQTMDDLLREGGTLTPAQTQARHLHLKHCHTLLQDLEAHGINPSLCGTFRK
jgi:hypothetical protein